MSRGFFLFPFLSGTGAPACEFYLRPADASPARVPVPQKKIATAIREPQTLTMENREK
jgi:hypothetical protein